VVKVVHLAKQSMDATHAYLERQTMDMASTISGTPIWEQLLNTITTIIMQNMCITIQLMPMILISAQVSISNY
jgi:hypothetical protein